MRRHANLVRIALSAGAVVGVAGCLQRTVPKDVSIEATFPTASAVRTLPRKLKLVEFNVHGEKARKVIDGIRNDRALREADLIILEEIHRDESIAEPCSAA